MTRRAWTLAAVSIATFMLLLDITVVNTALPSIERDLGGSFSDLQWVVDAYTLTLAAVVLTAGSIADRIGRRRTFVVGLAVFSFASLLAALSPSAGFLIGARALQGVGGAIMFALSLALIAQEYAPGRERAKAMGVYGAVIGGGVAIGPLVGGALTDAIGWESIFYLNVPVGIAAIAIARRYVRETRDPGATRADWPGVATFSGGLFMFVLALLRGNQDGWGSAPIVALFAGAAVLLAAFVVVERRSRQPMLPLELFRNPSFAGVQIAAFAISASLYAIFLYLTLYLQGFLGHSPLTAGLMYLPATLLSFVVAGAVSPLITRVPARVMLGGGLAMIGVGIVMITGLDESDGFTTILPGFVLTGIGSGIVNVVMGDVALSVVPKERAGMASGINDTFRQVGVSVGIAVWGAIFLGSGASRVAELAAGTPAASGDNPRRLVEAISSGHLSQVVAAAPPGVRPAVVHAAREGFLSGFNEILLLGGSLAILGGLATALLVRGRADERETAGLAQAALA